MRLGTRPPLSRPDGRESIRLELVAVAAEVATLATRAQEEAVPHAERDELDVVVAQAQELLAKAWQVLDFDSGIQAMDVAQLQSWLAAFQGYRREAALLRARHQRPERARPPRRGISCFFTPG